MRPEGGFEETHGQENIQQQQGFDRGQTEIKLKQGRALASTTRLCVTSLVPSSVRAFPYLTGDSKMEIVILLIAAAVFWNAIGRPKGNF